MKKTTKISALCVAVAALLLLAGYGTAFGQGTINFDTLNSTNGPSGVGYGEVFQSGGVTPANASFYAVLLGSTSFGGTYSVIGSVVTFNTIPGYAIDISGIPITTAGGIGSTYYYELAVWSVSAGATYAAYSTAETTSGDQYGTSEIASAVLGGGINTPPDSNGFHSFTLTLVPEPVTCALMGLGGLSLLLFRRRK
jgi:hypothetical protein